MVNHDVYFLKAEGARGEGDAQLSDTNRPPAKVKAKSLIIPFLSKTSPKA